MAKYRAFASKSNMEQPPVIETSSFPTFYDYGYVISGRDFKSIYYGDNLRLSGYDILGTYTGIEDWYYGEKQYTIHGLSMNETEVFLAIFSGKNQFQNFLSGNDSVLGNGKDNELSGYTGSDKVYGKGGTDVLFGAKGKDQLFGGDGRDTLKGGVGNDKLNGGRGDDILTGGKGADDFIFKGKFGKDVIRDFAANNRYEDIDLKGVTAITGFKDLKNNHMSQKGDDVLIKAGKNTILLEDVDLSDLQAQDFLF